MDQTAKDNPDDLGRAARKAFRAYYGDDPISWSDLSAAQRKQWEAVAGVFFGATREDIEGVKRAAVERTIEYWREDAVNFVSESSKRPTRFRAMSDGDKFKLLTRSAGVALEDL